MLVFDFEVFRYDWLVLFKDTTNQTYHSIINDREALREFYEANKHKLHIGFNNKRYDNLVYRAILDGADPYIVNELIITYNNPLKVYRTWNLNKWWYPSMDVGQDTMRGSLKEFEGYLGLDIDESTIPFDIDRKLTDAEIEDTLSYCKSDVDATERLIEVNMESLKTKMALVKEFDLSMRDLDKTNAQLVAKVLRADKQSFTDEFKPFPFENHVLELPTHLGEVKVKGKVVRMSNIYDFYNKAPNYDEKLYIDIAGVPHILAYGGIHGAIPNKIHRGEMWLLDVTSYYPSIMREYDYLSRAVKDDNRSSYGEMIDERVKIKKSNPVRSNILKLILNTTFGGSKAEFNDLYDPHNANNICISGQLMLVSLIHQLGDSIELLQSNTDGVLVIPKDKERVKEVVSKWEKETGMGMGIEIYNKLFQKDVNNYIAVEESGHITVKGAYVSQTTVNGNKPFSIRRTGKIIDDAVVNYFVNGVLPETTINNCNDKLDFQLIRKTGRTYDGTVWENKGVDVEANWVNRVYASKNKSYGKLFKVRDDGTRATVPSLPDHCYLANVDDFDLRDLDRQYYIDEAWKRIKDYEG